MGSFPPSGAKANTRGQRKVRREFLGRVLAVQRPAGRVGDLGGGEQRCLVGSGSLGPRAGALSRPPAGPGVQSARRAGAPGGFRGRRGLPPAALREQPQAFLARRLRLTSLPRLLHRKPRLQGRVATERSVFNSGAGQRAGSAPCAPPSSEVPEPAEPASGAPGSAGREERAEVSAAGDSLRPFPRGVGAGHPGSGSCAGPASAQPGQVGARRGRTAAVAGAEGSPADPSRRFPGRPQSGPRTGSPGFGARCAAGLGPCGRGARRAWLRAAGKSGRSARPFDAPGPFDPLGMGWEIPSETSPREVLRSTGGQAVALLISVPERQVASSRPQPTGRGLGPRSEGRQVGEGCGNSASGPRDSVGTAWASGGSVTSGRGRVRVP